MKEYIIGTIFLKNNPSPMAVNIRDFDYKDKQILNEEPLPSTGFLYKKRYHEEKVLKEVEPNGYCDCVFKLTYIDDEKAILSTIHEGHLYDETISLDKLDIEFTDIKTFFKTAKFLNLEGYRSVPLTDGDNSYYRSNMPNYFHPLSERDKGYTLTRTDVKTDRRTFNEIKTQHFFSSSFDHQDIILCYDENHMIIHRTYLNLTNSLTKQNGLMIVPKKYIDESQWFVANRRMVIFINPEDIIEDLEYIVKDIDKGSRKSLR